MIGTTLQNRYRVTELIGDSMSRVYIANDIRLNERPCVIKVFKADETATAEQQQNYQALFAQETRLLSQLDHTNLPTVLDSFRDNGQTCLVMEYIDGQTLETIIDTTPDGLPESAVLSYANQLCQALSYLHDQPDPIIFRDLKPGNIMVDHNGTVKLIDFGIARIFKNTSTSDTLRMGTMGYAPPEQYRKDGQTDVRSDIYSLGATLHHLLTGRDPTQEPPFSFARIRDSKPAVSERTSQTISKALAYDRKDRWHTVEEMRARLLGERVTPLPQPKPLTPSVNGNRPKPHRPTTKLLIRAAKLTTGQLMMGAVALVVAVLAGIYYLVPFLAQIDLFWDNIPTVAIIAPAIYAATRRRLLPGMGHALIALLGAITIYSRIGDSGVNNDNLFIAAAVSGIIIELILWQMTKRIGDHERDEEGVWQTEIVFLIVAAIAGQITLSWLVIDFTYAAYIGRWIGAAIMAAIGWFLGDLVQGYLYLKQTGLKWRD